MTFDDEETALLKKYENRLKDYDGFKNDITNLEGNIAKIRELREANKNAEQLSLFGSDALSALTGEL